ncbi:MAG: hypothetical protein U1E34_00090 [Amaricoccus sp.]
MLAELQRADPDTTLPAWTIDGGMRARANGDAAVTEAPHRVRPRRAKGWRLPENTVVGAWPGPEGNPDIVGRQGIAQECVGRYRLLLAGFVMLGERAEFLARHAARNHALAHLAKLRRRSPRRRRLQR